MNAGVLQFTIGLASGGFLSSLGAANAKLTSFIGGMVSLGAITAGVMHAIEKGAALEHLHKRTGESVGDLYKLEKGFKAAGLSAEDVGPALFQMQKSLGGVNELGERTDDIFRRMGLSAGTLKRMGGADALKAILQGMSRLNQSDMAKAASSIFGRMQAGNMIQLARSSGELAKGMRNAASQAAILERSAEAFAHIEINMEAIRGKAMALFAGIAEGLAPAIENVADSLNSIDLTNLGEQLGRYLTALTQAFREGTFADLIATSLKTGFEVGIAALPASLEKIGSMLIKVFETPLTWLQARFEWIIQNVMEQLAKYPIFDESIIPKGFKADSWSQIYADEKKNGLKFNLGTGDFGIEDISADADKNWQEAKAKIAEIAKPLMGMIDGLVARAPKVKSAGDKLNKSAEADISQTSTYKPEFTSLEKMGFVMGGLGNPLVDHARATAANTARTNSILERIASSFANQGSIEPYNQPL